MSTLKLPPHSRYPGPDGSIITWTPQLTDYDRTLVWDLEVTYREHVWRSRVSDKDYRDVYLRALMEEDAVRNLQASYLRRIDHRLMKEHLAGLQWAPKDIKIIETQTQKRRMLIAEGL